MNFWALIFHDCLENGLLGKWTVLKNQNAYLVLYLSFLIIWYLFLQTYWASIRFKKTWFRVVSRENMFNSSNCWPSCNERIPNRKCFRKCSFITGLIFLLCIFRISMRFPTVFIWCKFFDQKFLPSIAIYFLCFES